MPNGDSPGDARSSFSRKAGALVIDLALLGAMVYAGRIIAAAVVVYLDNLARRLVMEPGGPASLAEFQAQIRVHPFLLGRPRLFEFLCSDLGPAAVLLWYLGFLKAQFDGVTPGAMFLRAQAVWPRISNALNSRFGQLASLVSQTIESWLPGSGGIASLRKRVANVSGLFAPARMLPAGSRAIGLAALVIVAVAAAATPLVYTFNHSLAQVGFENAYGKTAFVAQISLWLALAAIAVGWAAVLVGASMTNLLAVAVVAPVYVFSFVFLGLAGGRAWWLALPQWILPALAAIAPAAPRRWPLRLAVLWALCALAVLHSFRLTPLHAFAAWSSWRIVLPLGLLAALAIGRLRRRPSSVVLFVGLLAVNGAFIGAALRAGIAPIAAGVNESLYQLAGILTLFWFFLGANVVSGCVGLTRSTVSAANRLCAEPSLGWLVAGVCMAELFVIGELMRFNPAFMHEARAAGQTTIRISTLPAHQGIAIAILLVAALFAARGGFTPGRARGLLAMWGFSLFLIWSFFLAAVALLTPAGAALAPSATALHHGFGLLQGIEKRLGGERQLVAIGLVTFTMLWEVFAGARREDAPDARWAQAPGALILYLGGLALLVALTHFAFLSATMSPQAADAYMYSGMQALWMPIALYAAGSALAEPPGNGQRLLIGAFLVGMLAATPVCFQRVLIGDPARIGLWANLSVVAASESIILVCVAVGVWRAPMRRAIDAAAAAIACALGFAVAYTQGLIAPLLSQFTGIVSALTGFASALGAMNSWLEPARWNVVPHGDLLIFYLAVPASAGAAAVLLWNAMQRGKPRAAALVVPAILAATVACAIPIYISETLRRPFTPNSAAVFTPVAYARSIGCVTALVLMSAWYIYAGAWRAGALQSAELPARQSSKLPSTP